MKKTIFSLATAAIIAASCSDTADIITPDAPIIAPSDKEMISFSMSDGTEALGATRATTRAGFTGADTRIVARFQSDEKDGSGVRYTRTVLKAAKDNAGGANDYSVVTYYTTDNTRYWDDAFGRKGQISVYAVAIPNSIDDTKLTDGKLAGGSTWAAEGSPNNNIQWDVTYGTQTSATLLAEDLVYSNNIQSTGTNGRYVWDYDATPNPGYPADNGRLDGHKNGRLVFTQKEGALESDAGHFDKGHLMFNHALSRLTVTLVEGAGFDGAAFVDAEHSDFKFKTSTGNIKLLSFPYTGALNIKDGSWGNVTPHDIDQMIGATVSAAGDFSAQMLPGYKFYGTGTHAADNVMQFVIDDNTYYVTQKQVYDALNIEANTTGANPLVVVENDGESYIEMKQGKNYKLSITVKKTPIVDVTATLAPWVEVAGSMEVNNAHISLTLKTTGATCDKDVDLYRLDDDNAGYDADNYDFSYQGKNWFGNYSTDAMHKTQLLHSALSAGKWTTPWYFESNKTYYHFRTVNSGTTIEGTGDDDVKDYFNIAAGPIASTDPHWGAPMKSTSTTWLKYDTENGYAAYLHHAIGATESQIAIQELHMMSNINVVLETPNDGGKVQLYKPAVAAVLYADVDEYNTAKGTSLDADAFAALPEADKTKTAAQPAVGTIIKITRLATTGKVEMGRGLVTPTGAYTGESTMTSPSNASAADYYTTTGVTNGTQSKTYTYAVVPQSLSRDFDSTSDDDYVGIFIQTPDHNQYYVVKKLSEITATTVTDQRDQTQGARIQRWFPGHTYTYTFTITKTDIKNVTATVADWVNVTGQNTNITLEN